MVQRSKTEWAEVSKKEDTIIRRVYEVYDELHPLRHNVYYRDEAEQNHPPSNPKSYILEFSGFLCSGLVEHMDLIAKDEALKKINECSTTIFIDYYAILSAEDVKTFFQKLMVEHLCKLFRSTSVDGINFISITFSSIKKYLKSPQRPEGWFNKSLSRWFQKCRSFSVDEMFDEYIRLTNIAFGIDYDYSPVFVLDSIRPSSWQMTDIRASDEVNHTWLSLLLSQLAGRRNPLCICAGSHNGGIERMTNMPLIDPLVIHWDQLTDARNRSDDFAIRIDHDDLSMFLIHYTYHVPSLMFLAHEALFNHMRDGKRDCHSIIKNFEGTSVDGINFISITFSSIKKYLKSPQRPEGWFNKSLSRWFQKCRSFSVDEMFDEYIRLTNIAFGIDYDYSPVFVLDSIRPSSWQKTDIRASDEVNHTWLSLLLSQLAGWRNPLCICAGSHNGGIERTTNMPLIDPLVIHWDQLTDARNRSDDFAIRIDHDDLSMFLIHYTYHVPKTANEIDIPLSKILKDNKLTDNDVAHIILKCGVNWKVTDVDENLPGTQIPYARLISKSIIFPYGDVLKTVPKEVEVDAVQPGGPKKRRRPNKVDTEFFKEVVTVQE
ncbi:hypothetical protein MP638_000791 [Amoeboaphelidium occidentale]|nr:hypothetical protein MP638_000791 [Amoeboaphelidium occidentale]